MASAQEKEGGGVPGLSEETLEVIDRALKAGDPWEREGAFAEACRRVLVETGLLDPLIERLEKESRSSDRAAILLTRAAWEKGDLDLARTALSGPAASRDADARTLAELARIEELLGEDREAIALMDRALAAGPESIEVFALEIRKVHLLYDTGKKQAAGRLLEKWAAASPKDPDRRFFAYLAALHDDYETAVELLAPFEGLKDRCREPLFLGLFFLRLGRHDAAQKAYEAAFTCAKKGRDRLYALEGMAESARASGTLSELADRWLARENPHPDLLNFLVSLLHELGRLDDALSLLKRSKEVFEPGTLKDPGLLQREFISIAVEAGRTGEAEEAYGKLLDAHPKNAALEQGLARLLCLTGRKEKAVRLFSEWINAAEGTDRLFDLAKGARTLALYDVALFAVRKAGRAGRPDRVSAGLLEADLLREKGDADRALVLLEELESFADPDPALLMPVAEAFERFGDRAEALRLFTRLYEKTGSEDLLERVAWLLEEKGSLEEAYALWKAHFKETHVEARRRQAEERLLDLASRTAQLADLVIELEERLDAGMAQDHELSLLVEIYTRVNDPVSAAEILHAFGERSGNRIEGSRRLARVYLTCGQFKRCASILRRLVRLDPQRADEYLQQIAMVAVEGRRPREARAALNDLSAMNATDGRMDEFAAGVLVLLGDPVGAAQAYARLLARDPDRIEAHLLWGEAMKGAGRRLPAASRFQCLLEEAEESDLFVVAVDGLLNLDAPQTALRSALRRVYTRIAARPDKVYLYRLAADLNEALGRRKKMDALIEQAAVVAGERRGALLRELMDSAAAEENTDRVIRFGRSIVAMGMEAPPDVFLGLGEALLREGDLALAERTFERADFGRDVAMIRGRVADAYEKANLPGRAERIIRELLIMKPDEVSLLIRSGNLLEQTGRFEEAFGRYHAAADRMLRRLPGAVKTGSEGVSDRAGAERSKRRRAADLNEFSQYFEAAQQGLFTAARSETLRDFLLENAETRVRKELEELAGKGQVAADLEGNPRLDRSADFARQIAFRLHAPDLADRLDQALLDAYQRDGTLRARLVRSRVEWGLLKRAAAFEKPTGEGDGGSPLPGLARFLEDPSKYESTLFARRFDVERAHGLLPHLIMTGRDEQARRLLQALQDHRTAVPAASFPRFFAAALALKDREAVGTLMEAWIDAAGKMPDGKKAVEALGRIIRLAWNHLDDEKRKGLADRIGALAESFGSGGVPLMLLRMDLLQALGQPLDDRKAILEAAASCRGIDTDRLARLLEEAPEASRPRLLSLMTGARKPGERRTFLLELIPFLRIPVTREWAKTWEDLFKTAPAWKLDPKKAYSQVTGSGWLEVRGHPDLVIRLSRVLREAYPNEPAVLVAAAQALNHAGREREAREPAGRALDLLLAVPEPMFYHRRMLDALVSIQTPGECSASAQRILDLGKTAGSTPIKLFAAGLFLEGADRTADAHDAFRDAFKRAPGNRVLSRNIIQRLQEAGRGKELARLLASHVRKSTIMESFEWRTLTRTLRDLHALKEAAKAALKDESPIAPVEAIRISVLRGRRQEARATLRRFLIKNRNEGRYYTPSLTITDPAGGLQAYLAVSSRDSRIRREGLYVWLAGRSGTFEEISAFLLAAPPGRNDVSGLIEGLAQCAESDLAVRADLLASLAKTYRKNAMTRKNHLLLIALAARVSEDLPPALAPALDDALLLTNPDDADSLTTLAAIYRGFGRPDRARSILEWLLARDLTVPRRSWRDDAPFWRINDHNALLAETGEEVDPASRLRLLDPGPLDDLHDEFDAKRLEAWMATNRFSETGQRMAAVEGRLPSDPSGRAFRRIRTTLARWSALSDRYDAFEEKIGDLLDSPGADRGPEVVVDAFEVLPAKDALSEPDRYIMALADAVETRLEQGALTREAGVRALCLAGQWCLEWGLDDRAAAMIARGSTHAGPWGRHHLWIADLCRSAGRKDAAWAIERSLLEEDLLPVARVPALLDAVEKAFGADEAAALARRVAEYSDDPAVLERLIADARKKGDRSAERLFRDRLH